MKIGIDIDGVLTDSLKFKLDYGKKFADENNIKYSINLKRHETYEMFSWSDEIDKKFWNQYYLLYATSCKYIRDDAITVIEQLISSGDEIIIVTGREDADLQRIGLSLSMEAITKKWLDDNCIPYHKLEIAVTHKYKYVQKNNIDIFIDDLPYFIKMFPKDYPCICFDCTYNRDIDINERNRAYDWLNVLKIINIIKEEKSIE